MASEVENKNKLGNTKNETDLMRGKTASRFTQLKKLEYDFDKYEERFNPITGSLMLFITNRCNLRCPECFYRHHLGKGEMSFDEYKANVNNYSDDIGKVIILGGEPTLHANLADMVEYNNESGLITTVFTNGHNLKKFEDIDLSKTSIKLSVMSETLDQKLIDSIHETELPLAFIYLLKQDNVDGLLPFANFIEDEFDSKKFAISNIRDIMISGSYWKDTKSTLSFEDYAKVVSKFLDDYSGNMQISIAGRGYLYSDVMHADVVDYCRYGSIFPNNEKVICPLDIDIYKTSPELNFKTNKCDKHSECVLRKIVLEKRKDYS